MVEGGAGLEARSKNVAHQDDEVSALVRRATAKKDGAMDPRYPVGTFVYDKQITAEKRRGWIAQLDALPRDVRQALSEIAREALDTPYRPGGWTARQVVHHLADSHMNAYIRIKLALTEDAPTVKTYEEQLWAELPDGKGADPALSLAILDGVHQRLTQVLESLDDAQFARAATHPEHGQISVDFLLQMYAWHCRHHVGHLRLVGQAASPRAS